MRIDTRAGSKDLIVPLRMAGVQVEEAILPYGDVEILGNGPGGPVLLGVEYKKLGDLLDSMRSGRFADQLRGMRETYNINWLLVEGRMTGVERGEFLKIKVGGKQYRHWVQRPGRFSYQEVVGWSLTMSLKGGCLLWRTEDISETVEWLRCVDNWFTSKDWENHRAHLDWYSPSPEGNPFEEPSLVQKVAAVLPGLGSSRSRNVASHFGSVRAMIMADEKEWSKIDGVGIKTAKKLVEILK